MIYAQVQHIVGNGQLCRVAFNLQLFKKVAKLNFMEETTPSSLTHISMELQKSHRMQWNNPFKINRTAATVTHIS